MIQWFWTQEASHNRLAIGDGLLAIGTGTYDFVKVRQQHDLAPPLNLAAWDHVTECDLEVKSRFILIMGCLSQSGLFFEVKPGHYRVRACHANLAQSEQEVPSNWTGDLRDWYLVQFWPSKSLMSQVLSATEPNQLPKEISVAFQAVFLQTGKAEIFGDGIVKGRFGRGSCQTGSCFLSCPLPGPFFGLAVSTRSACSKSLFCSEFTINVPPVSLPSAQRVQALLAQLDADAFAEREAAYQELRSLHIVVEADLRQALGKKPNLNVQRQLERLFEDLEIKDLGIPPGDRLRAAARSGCWRPCRGRRPGSTWNSLREAPRKRLRPRPPVPR